MTSLYILDKDDNPLLEQDVLKWAEWSRENYGRRRVAITKIGSATVSTVFLGVDHSFWPWHQPILYETMIFWKDNELDEEQTRYSTREEAIEGHEEAVAKVKSYVR